MWGWDWMDGIGWMGWLSYTAVTPRASLQSDAKNEKYGGKFLVSPDLPSPRLHPPSIRGTRLVPMFCHKSAIHRPGWLYSQYRIQYNFKSSKVCVSVFHIAWRLMQSLTCVSHTEVDKPYRGSFATF